MLPVLTQLMADCMRLLLEQRRAHKDFLWRNRHTFCLIMLDQQLTMPPICIAWTGASSAYRWISGCTKYLLVRGVTFRSGYSFQRAPGHS